MWLLALPAGRLSVAESGFHLIQHLNKNVECVTYRAFSQVLQEEEVCLFQGMFLTGSRMTK